MVAGIAFGLTLPPPLIAAAGGLATAALTALMAWKRAEGTPPLTLILVGLGVGFSASALATLLMTLLPGTAAAEAQRWITGSLAARNWRDAAQVWGLGLPLALCALVQVRHLSALELGEELSGGLGLNVGRARWSLAGTAVLLAAAGGGGCRAGALRGADGGAARHPVDRGARDRHAAGCGGGDRGGGHGRGATSSPGRRCRACSCRSAWRRGCSARPTCCGRLSPRNGKGRAVSLRTQALTLGYRDRQVISGLDLELPEGAVTTILGPNGCGKSTLLKALARLVQPVSGRVTLHGEDIHTRPTRALARALAILPQAPIAPEGITVGDLVKRGRTPWRGILSPWRAEDAAACAEALAAVNLTELADRPLAELSGGQRQRAWIALVLAQATPLLLLDEPTTFLDLPHQIEVLSLLRRRNRETGLTVISVLHDLNLAARFSDRLVLLGPGGLVACGTPDEVLTPAHLEAAFGLRAEVVPDPVAGTPMVIPL